MNWGSRPPRDAADRQMEAIGNNIFQFHPSISIDREDPALVQMIVKGVMRSPDLDTTWTAVKELRADIDEDSAIVLVKCGMDMLNASPVPELMSVIFSVIANVCVPSLEDLMDIFLDTGILEHAVNVLSMNPPQEMMMSALTILEAAFNPEDFSVEDEWSEAELAQINEIANRYHTVFLAIAEHFRSNDLIVSQALTVSSMIVCNLPINDESTCLLLNVYISLLVDDTRGYTGDAMEAIHTLLDMHPGLNELMIQEPGKLENLIFYINNESLTAVEHAAHIFLPILAHAEELPSELVVTIATRIREAIGYYSKNNWNIDNLLKDLEAIATAGPTGCRIVLELGILTSNLLTSRSYTCTTTMLRIYAAASSAGLMCYGEEFVHQVVSNVTDSLESDDEPMIHLAVHIMAHLHTLGYRFDVYDRLDELQNHENPEIAEGAAALLSMCYE